MLMELFGIFLGSLICLCVVLWPGVGRTPKANPDRAEDTRVSCKNIHRLRKQVSMLMHTLLRLDIKSRFLIATPSKELFLVKLYSCSPSDMRSQLSIVVLLGLLMTTNSAPTEMSMNRSTSDQTVRLKANCSISWHSARKSLHGRRFWKARQRDTTPWRQSHAQRSHQVHRQCDDQEARSWQLQPQPDHQIYWWFDQWGWSSSDQEGRGFSNNIHEWTNDMMKKDSDSKSKRDELDAPGFAHGEEWRWQRYSPQNSGSLWMTRWERLSSATAQ